MRPSVFQNPQRLLILVGLLTLLIACDHEDPGPLQRVEKDFTIADFDRLEMGSGFHITVDQANAFSVRVRGDRRNIDDLDVYRSGNTLVIEFDEQRNRHHDTYIDITMPALTAVNFSGGSESRIRGFQGDALASIYLSGASLCQLDSEFERLDVVVSGASELLLFGSGDILNAEISGASTLSAFEYPVNKATVEISGASHTRLTVEEELNVDAEGASSVLYRGNPTVNANTSGSSSVEED